MSRSQTSPLTWDRLLAALQETPARLREGIADLPEERLDEPIEPGGWTVRRLLGHLCATELPYRARLARIVLEDNPHLAAIERLDGGFDPRTPVGFLLETFASLRAETVAFLAGLPPSARARPARLAGLGPITLRQQARALLAHDQEHLEALRSLKGDK